MIKLKIDDQLIEVPQSYSVLQAAASIGITIPTLCYHKDLSPFGGCRLCVVEVQNARMPMTACNLPVSPGLQIRTHTPALMEYRRAVLRMLLLNYYDGGYKRYNGKFDLDQDNELVRWATEYGVDVRSNMAGAPSLPIDSDPNPFVWVDMNKCIQCTRCVRACAEVQGRFVWSQSYRGYKARIVAGADTTMLQARCESCGACVVYCPTGALDNKMSVSAGRPDRLVRTTCAYCGVGCQLDLNVKDDAPGGRLIRVTSNEDHPVTSTNGLHLCVKGRYGYEFVHSANRQTRPRVRQYLLDTNYKPGAPRPAQRGRWVEVDWDTALQAAARGLNQVRQQHGGASLAVLASGRLTNEENYLLNKLARQILGTNNIDCASHVLFANETAGLMEAVGLPAMSNSFDDIAANAQAVLVIGSNLSEQHPVFGARLRQAILRRKVKLVAASPDFINISEYAALSLTHHPHTETALLNGLMHIMITDVSGLHGLVGGWEGVSSAEKIKGFDEFKAVIERYTPERVAEITGVQPAALYQAAELLATNKPMSVLWGANLADPHTARSAVLSLANLQLLLGNLGRPGGGLNPLRSQNNLQGACDMGCLPDRLPGYQPIDSAAARGAFEQAWGASLPGEPGLPAAQSLAGAGDEQTKALYLVGEEFLNTSPAAARLRQALETCEFIVLQESQASEMTRYADVLLPGVSFAEKTGTFTSAERRVQLIRQAIEPVGQSRPDWQIIAELAERIRSAGGRSFGPAPYAGWEYSDPAEILQEIAALTPIYTGISHARLAHNERLHWPVESEAHAGTPLLPPGYFTAGQVRFTPVEQPQVQPDDLAVMIRA
jgi:predicted molibdopterin-dependent oxidoreductase YjgC